MSKIRLYGDTSGYVDLTAPAVADNSAIDISNPTFSGNLSANGTITSGVDNNSYMRVGRYSSGYGGSALNTYGGSSFLSMQVEGVEAIRANSSGYVTMPYQPSSLAYLSSNQSLSASTWSKVNLNIVRFDQGSIFNTSNGRFTAPVSGKYFFSYAVNFQDSTTGYLYTGIQVNGTFYHYGEGRNASSWNSDNTLGNGQLVDLSSGDYVELFAYSGGSNTLASGVQRTYLSLHFLG